VLTYAQIEKAILAKLDAEGSERYLPEQDIIPAINAAVSRVQAAASYMLANRKGSEEILRDFTRVSIFQTSVDGWVALTGMGHTVSNVVAVYPQPDLKKEVGSGEPHVIVGNQSSLYRGDLVYLGANKPCKRVTMEMVPVIKDNSIMEGNEVTAHTPRFQWAYYLNQGRIYLLPRSRASQVFCAVAYIENFAPMTDTSGTVSLPDYMLQQLATWAAYYVTWKQDPSAEGYRVIAARDASELFGFSTN